MDFFDQQATAKRATFLLIPLFILALMVLVILVNLGVLGLWHVLSFMLVIDRINGVTLTAPSFADYWSSTTCLITSIMTVLVLTGGSVRRAMQLRKSNMAVAELVDAAEITHATATSEEKQLSNVAAEIAVAAGTPVPRLFVMREEKAINAFVTGLPPQQLLVVTQGALDHLNRDELQGVIGHEFSHLLNGDIRLNLRMMALLAGLLGIGQLGQYLLNTKQLSRPYDDDRERSSPVVGIVLITAGYAGLFIARLIKAAVSRQRESLADASSRQFTRSEGLANALVKIKNGAGAQLSHPHAEDINHMCFGDAITVRFQRLLATHPDLDDRLRQIDPSWVARARARKRQKQRQSQEKETGFPDNKTHLDYAKGLLANIPDTLRQRLHSPDSACLVVYGLLADVEQPSQLPAISQDDKLVLSFLVEQVDNLGNRYRLPLIELALPALQQLDGNSRNRFLTNIDWLIKADNQVSLFEYLLRELVHYHLKPERLDKIRYTRLTQVASQTQLLLSSLIYTATGDNGQQQKLFKQHAASLLPPGRQLLPLRECALKPLAEALHQLRELSPLLKKPLVQSCTDVVLADNKAEIKEIELLRLVCVLIDSPMPLLATR